MFAHVTGPFADHVLAVDCQNPVAGQQVGQSGRHLVVGFADANRIVQLHDDGTDAGIFARCHGFELLLVVLGIELRIRIQFLQHRIDAGRQDTTPIDTVNISRLQCAYGGS